MQTPFRRPFWSGMKALVFLLLLCSGFHAGAKIIFGEHGSDDEEAPQEKKEVSVVLPGFPEEANLLPFEVSPTQTQAFFIDSRSLSVTNDEVRYTMVTKSRAGAVNVSYEGIRCGSYEVRRYAYGHRDGKWTMSKNEAWRPINFYAANRPWAVLAQEYLCDDKTVGGTAENMIFRIRYNRSLEKRKYMAN